MPAARYCYLTLLKPEQTIEHPRRKTPEKTSSPALNPAPNASLQDSAAIIVWQDLQTIAHIWAQALGANQSEHTAFIHTNHLGAPEAVTDESAQPVWQASYAPFGAILKTRLKAATAPLKANNANNAKTSEGGNLAFILNLRLPGQYEDAESGLHYNRQRYYDPQDGSYISPDPLGTPDGPNPYAYTAFNPLKYVDPDGLVLFAFDGTGNTNDTDGAAELAALGNGVSNVWRFNQLYNDGNARYVSGVGTTHVDQQNGNIVPADFSRGTLLGLVPGVSLVEADMGGNYSGPARIERMEAYFNAEAELFTDNTGMMDVDIIGFSRGAAQAREFANRINARTRNGQYSYTIRDAQGNQAQRCQMINFRFLGLWDTVLSENRSGVGYNTDIVRGFQHVAHAVALNEYRGDTLRRMPNSTGAFPLRSVMVGTVPYGQTRIERGFIGAHADIGGGFQGQDNGLPLVTLNWMIEQARDAGVTMRDAPSRIDINPIIHDKSDNQYCLNGPGCSEDRRVNGGAGGTQRNMTGTGMTHANTGQFITYYPSETVTNIASGNQVQVRNPRADASTGTVDMARYLEWLRSNGYDLGNLQAR